ncbi:uncharacterized protein [Argopecten irradians]|uniref:uncharacterized protein n=1 Tax=Argopecten irradians TaxID=31199 RepID=UPI0037198D97
MNIKEVKRKRAMLLHYVGEEVCDIFETLQDTGDIFNDAQIKLTEYFAPKKATEFQVYQFRQISQESGESIDAFTTKLRQQSSRCDFVNPEKAIKSQIIQGCCSSKLRRRALREEISLDNLLQLARSMEIADTQAEVIEKRNQRDTGMSEEVHKLNKQPKRASSGKTNLDFIIIIERRLQFRQYVETVEEIFPIQKKGHVRLKGKSVITAKRLDILQNGIGKCKNVKIKLHIDTDVQPVSQPHRRIPFHVRKQVEKEIKRLGDLDIIEKVSGPTPWVSPIVVAPKPKNPGEIRLCVDMRQANKAIQRERHITPTIDDLIVDLNGSKVFSKLDLNAGYHQLELDDDSRNITTFTPHVGLRRYKSLSFGVSSAAEIFQNTPRTVLEGLNGVRNVSNDIIVYGKARHKLESCVRATRGE